jgi:hypothetical protein
MSHWLGLREDQRMGRGLSREIGRWLTLDICGGECKRERRAQLAGLRGPNLSSRMNSLPQSPLELQKD